MRAQNQNVTRAIVFLVATGAFVLANDAAVVLINRTAGHHANLFVPVHDQTIEIQTRGFFDLERTFPDQLLKIFQGLRVSLVTVDWSTFGKIDFRA